MRASHLCLFVTAFATLAGTASRRAFAEDAPVSPLPPVPDDDDAVLAWFDTLELPPAKGRPWVEVLSVGNGLREVVSAGVLLDDSPAGFVVLRDGLFRVRYPKDAVRWESAHEFRIVDLSRDVAALLESVSNPQSNRQKFSVFEGERPTGEVASLAARAHVCAERGELGLAHALVRAARALPRRDDEPTEVVRRVAGSLEVLWIWNAVVAFRDRDTSLSDLLGPIRAFLRTWPGSTHADQAKELAATLERMIDKATKRVTATTPLESMTVAEQISEWIFRLREQNGGQIMQPGSPSIWMDERGKESPAERLVAFGNEAIPALIDAIDDTDLTRTVGYWRDFTFSHYVLRVGDAALDIVERIAGRSFWSGTYTAASMTKDGQQKETQELVRLWWREFQAKGERAALIDSVRSGGDASSAQATRLLERYPADALEAIASGVRAAKDQTRFHLVQTLRFAKALDEAGLRRFFEGLLATEVSIEIRTMAASWLHEHGDTMVVATMIRDWIERAPRAVEPWNLRSEIGSLASFLVRCGSPEAARALASDLDSRDPAVRLEVVNAVASLMWGQARPPNLPAPHRDAIQDLLASLLVDDVTTGRSSNWGTGSIEDERLCDAAACAWLDLFAASSGHDFLGRPIAERDHAIANLLSERWKSGRGPKPDPALPSPLVTPIADAIVAPLVLALGGDDTSTTRAAQAALTRLGPGAGLALVRAASNLPEDRRAGAMELARELAMQVVHIDTDPESPAGAALDAARTEVVGRALGADRVVSIVSAILGAHPRGTIAIDLQILRRISDPGVIVRVNWRVVPVAKSELGFSLRGRRGSGWGLNMRRAADVTGKVEAIDDGWENLRREIEGVAALAPDAPFRIDVRLAPLR